MTTWTEVTKLADKITSDNTTGSMDRPFKILGIHHVAIGGEDKKRLHHLWIELLGLKIIGNYVSEKENVDEDIAVPSSGNSSVEFDLMQPIDPLKKPMVHKPPLNHIGLWVDNIHAAVKYLTGNGVRFAPGGIRIGAGGHEIAFIHPKNNDEFPVAGEGIMIELVQAPSDIIKELDG